MKTLSHETQKAIYRLKNDKGELIEKFARWQAEYTGCEYEDIYNDMLSMLTMARDVYGEFLEASTELSSAQEFYNLALATDAIVRNKNWNNMKVDYYEVTLLGILQRLHSLKVREYDENENCHYQNGFTDYIEELEKEYKSK